MAGDRCPECNALLSMVGIRHRCVPIEPDPQLEELKRQLVISSKLPSYKYRDPDKRRAYMRDAMRRRRAEGKK